MGVSAIGSPIELLSRSTLRRLPEINEAFLSARPFKYVIIDDFFALEFAESLLADFPAFDENAKTEFGERSQKSVIPALQSIGSTYRIADEMISSQPFLDWVGAVTSIDGLQYDPDYFGGGTHESRDGQELDPHVDFNRHPKTRAHRRLNLIVYLNKDWEDSWGGAIELHSNPRDADTNKIRSYAPIFNRAIIFETNEYSWHGFPRITLPESERHRSRKSLSIYLYTKEAPQTAVAAHATFYVQRQVYDVLKVGDVVDEKMLAELRNLTQRRDDYIAFYQHKEIEHSDTLDRVNRRLDEMACAALVPVTGPVILQRRTYGFEPDGWMLRQGGFQCEATMPVSRVKIEAWLPGGGEVVKITVRSADRSIEQELRSGEQFTIELDLAAAAGEIVDVRIEFDRPYRPSDVEGGGDTRELGCFIRRVSFTQPILDTLSKLINRTHVRFTRPAARQPH